jgi:hypothetical protein
MTKSQNEFKNLEIFSKLSANDFQSAVSEIVHVIALSHGIQIYSLLTEKPLPSIPSGNFFKISEFAAALLPPSRLVIQINFSI